MKKIVLLILISICILGCRTKKVVKTESSEHKKVENSSASNSEIREKVKESNVIESSAVKSADIKENKSSVEISGKVNRDNPLVYYNIIDGDTVGTIGISGIADFVIKNNSSNLKSTIFDKSTNKNYSEKYKSSVISETVKNITEVASKAQAKSSEVVKKGFTFGVYMVWIIAGVVTIGIIIGIFYIKKSTWWTKILTKFKSK